jgi:ribosomal silencing factor RsfS
MYNEFPAEALALVKLCVERYRAFNVKFIKTMCSDIKYIVIFSLHSNRQIKAIIQNLKSIFNENFDLNYKIGGDENWVVIDFGIMNIHMFLPEVRDYYNFDEFVYERYIDSIEFTSNIESNDQL